MEAPRGLSGIPNSGRAGGLDVYADALHDLGSALGEYTVEGGCYRRAFERGLVLVVPAEAPGPVTVWINRPTFTLDGARILAGQFTVAPGEGHVLLQRRPAPPAALVREFDTGLDPLWRWSALREESGVSYLHLDETPTGEECEHDLALDLVRYRPPRGRVTLWYRTSDPARESRSSSKWTIRIARNDSRSLIARLRLEASSRRGRRNSEP